MRPVYLVEMDKARPAVVLTREIVRPHLHNLTVAPITSTVRGLSTEVPVGPANGLDHDCVITCDNVTTVPATALRRIIGYLLPHQERALARALVLAFDLDAPL
ncbi:MAG: type II toxin-antitoxin system PemK/MazF family toxin [Micrococcales bacterium]|nr:type II toxin-antitoxin system PemK/MazF family toxin [Micrococcales bacterium]MCL2667066.1 type II toxin-antitoxin system PemK/MazF family toxin [Micrococcales bacterium]